MNRIRQAVREWLQIDAPAKDGELWIAEVRREVENVRRDIAGFERRENFSHKHAFNRFESALLVMQDLDKKVDALAEVLGIEFGPGDGQRASVIPVRSRSLFARAQKTAEAELILRRLRSEESRAAILVKDMRFVANEIEEARKRLANEKSPAGNAGKKGK